MSLLAGVASALAGLVLLGMAWRSSDRHTRRLWQWSVWLLGSLAFATGAAALTRTLIGV